MRFKGKSRRIQLFGHIVHIFSQVIQLDSAKLTFNFIFGENVMFFLEFEGQL
jgi:hypothetical protein